MDKSSCELGWVIDEPFPTSFTYESNSGKVNAHSFTLLHEDTSCAICQPMFDIQPIGGGPSDWLAI